MKPIRILHISDRYPGLHDAPGGAEIIARRFVDLFSTQGWSQALATTRPDHPPAVNADVAVFPVDTLESHLPGSAWITSVKSQLLPADPLAGASLERVLARFAPQVAVLHNVKQITLDAARTCRLCGCRVWVMVYDYVHFCPVEFFTDHNGRPCRSPGEKCSRCHPRKARTIRQWSQSLLPLRRDIFSPLFDHVEYFFVLSRASKALLCEGGIEEEKIVVVGQPLPAPPPPVSGDPEAILFVGWGQPRKGLLTVARSLEHLHRPFSFTAVGQSVDGDYMASVRRALTAAGIDPKAALKGPMESDALQRMMQDKGIVVISEQWENMSPAVLHEAMAAGKTVVAGRIGGIPEFIRHGETGFLVDYDDPVDFADKIDAVLGNAAVQARIGKAAARAAQIHTDPEEILRTVLGRLTEQSGRSPLMRHGHVETGPRQALHPARGRFADKGRQVNGEEE